MAGVVQECDELEQVLEMANRAGLDVATAVEEDKCDLGILVAEPVGLDATGKINRLRCEVTLLGKLVVCLGRGFVQVAGLWEGDGSELGAKSGEGDVFEVGWRAFGAFEWRGNQTGDSCEDYALLAAACFAFQRETDRSS